MKLITPESIDGITGAVLYHMRMNWKQKEDAALVHKINKLVDVDGKAGRKIDVKALKDEEVEEWLGGVHKADMIKFRISMLQLFNRRLKRVLRVVNVKQTGEKWFLGYKLSQMSHCIFMDQKMELLEAGLNVRLQIHTYTRENGSLAILQITVSFN